MMKWSAHTGSYVGIVGDCLVWVNGTFYQKHPNDDPAYWMQNSDDDDDDNVSFTPHLSEEDVKYYQEYINTP